MVEQATKTDKMMLLEERHGKPIDQVIIDTVNSEGSVKKAAAKLGMSGPGLLRWLKLLNIEVISEARKTRNGSKPGNGR